MRQLHVVAVSEDGRHVVLATGKGATRGDFRVAIDDRLSAAVRGDLPRPGEAEPAAVTPKEIQARLRAGESPEQIAASAGVPITKVERYAGPVLSEIERVIAQARSGFVSRSRLGESALPLGEAVDRHLADTTGVRLETVQWSARREDGGTWLVELAYVSQARRRVATWRYDVARREVTATDSASAALAHVEPSGRRSRASGNDVGHADGVPAARAPHPAARSRARRGTPVRPVTSPTRTVSARPAAAAPGAAAAAQRPAAPAARAAAPARPAAAARPVAAAQAKAAEDRAAQTAAADQARRAEQAVARAAAAEAARKAKAAAEREQKAAAAREAAAREKKAAAERESKAAAAREKKAAAEREKKAAATREAKEAAAREKKAAAAREKKAAAERERKAAAAREKKAAAERERKAAAAREAKETAAREKKAAAEQARRVQAAEAKAAAAAAKEAAAATAAATAVDRTEPAPPVEDQATVPAPTGPPTLRVVGSDDAATKRREPKEPPAAARTAPARAAGQRASVPGWADVLLSTAPVVRQDDPDRDAD